MILITCKVCSTIFEWNRGFKKGRQPTICYTAECRKLRDHLCYEKWKANHPVIRYAKNKEKKKYKNISKATPKPKTKRFCQYPRCRRLTAYGGVNYLYCQQHWDELQEQCSCEYPEYIYDTDTVSMNLAFR